MRSQETRNNASATKTRNLRRLLHAYMEEAANNDLIGVGDRIRQARLEAGLTQDELSDLIGVGMRQIQYYEAGDSNPYRTLRRIAEVTGKGIDWLLRGDPPNTISVEQVTEQLKTLTAGQERIEETLNEVRSLLGELLQRVNVSTYLV